MSNQHNKLHIKQHKNSEPAHGNKLAPERELAVETEPETPESETELLSESELLKKEKVLKSAALISVCTMISRVSGFIRTWAMAFSLGNTVLASGFSLANNMPNMIYELICGGALAAAFVPVYHMQKSAHGKQAALSYGRNILNLSLIALGVVAVLASIFSPEVMFTQSAFSSSEDEAVEYAVYFFRFFAFQMIFYGISAIFSGLLNAEREYFWPAVSSVFMNIICIITFLGYVPLSDAGDDFANVWLAVGTVLSIAVMAMVQIPALLRAGFRFSFRLKLRECALRETMQLALPAIASTAINLVALSFMNSCSLNVSDIGPASVSYAWLWYQFPYGVLGVALSTALFTEMSDYASHKDWKGFARSLRGGLQTTLLVITPMAVLVFVCADQLIGLYSAGKFTPEDIEPISTLLCVWAINLPLYAAFMYITQAYSALKDMKTVAWLNLFMTTIQVFLYMLFTGVISPDFSLGLPGIAAADILKYLVIDTLLLAILHRRSARLRLGMIVPKVLKVVFASIVGGIVGLFVAGIMDKLVNTEVLLGAACALVITAASSLAIILLITRALGVNEISSVASGIISKIRRKKK